MVRMFSKDAYCLGLIYAYLYSGKKMVLVDDLKRFHNIIEKNLEEMESENLDMYATVWYDNDPSIYYSSEGKNGELYYVLYPNCDLEKAKSKYIGCISTNALVASQKDNALDCIGLIKVDGNIVRKERNVKSNICNANNFMNQFLENLKSGKLKIESCSQFEIEPELTEKFIIEQLENYQKILDNGLLSEVTKIEQGPVKKLTSNKK